MTSCITRLLIRISVALVTSSFFQANIAAQDRLLLVDDFDRGEQNRLGGYRNTYERTPSRADAMRIADVHMGRYGRGMRMQADRRETGFCGTWVHFFDFKAPVARYLDASRFKYLSFWVRGHEGSEVFTIKMADQRWIEKEDSVPLGRIDDYLPGGVTKQWQEVIVPLEGEHGLELTKLGGLIFDFDVPGQFTIYVDNVSFKSSRKALAPVNQPTQPAPVQATIASEKFDRTLWLWSTEELLDDPHKATEFFTFCRQQGIAQVWAQLLYHLRSEKRAGKVVSSHCTIKRPDAMRRLLRDAHKYGIEVHALDGYPEHAQREWHHISLAIVDAVIDFNRSAQKVDRFDGLHFDNEPHLLIGWHEPRRREQILFEFLTLNAECQRRTNKAAPKIKFGIDIPFWWQERDGHTREPIGAVTFNGKRQAASYHLIEMLDNVGVMNYRDQAQGADGMIAHGRELLEHAKKAKRAQIFMGVETFAYKPTEVIFAVGISREKFTEAVRGDATGLAKLSRVDRHRIRVFDDGENLHVGIELEKALAPADRMQVARTISTIARRFGANSIPLAQADIDKVTDRFSRALKKDSAWDNVRLQAVRDPTSSEKHPLVFATAAMLPKITFAGDGSKKFTTQLHAAEEFFGRYDAYAGIAVHHYETYRDLVGPTSKKQARLVTSGP